MPQINPAFENPYGKNNIPIATRPLKSENIVPITDTFPLIYVGLVYNLF